MNPKQQPTQEADTRTFEEAAEAWYTAKISDVRPKTKTIYRYHLDSNIYPALRNRLLTDITEDDLNSLKRSLLDYLSDETIVRALAVIKQIFKFSMRRKWITENPMEYFKSPTIDRQRQEEARDPFTPEEMIQFLEYAESINSPLSLIVRTALEGALRIGEVLGLRWDVVDFEKAQVTVRVQLQRIREDIKTELEFRTPKSHAGIRTFPLSEDLKRRLLEQQELQQEEDKRWRESGGKEFWNPDNLVFTNKGLAWDPGNISMRFRRLLEKAGVRHRPFHTLRNTAATWMSEGGTSIRDVQAMLGHARPAMALKYARSTMEGKRKGVNSITSRLGDTSGHEQ